MTDPPLAGLAALLADGTRARFCLALLDGRAWTAGELAGLAGVAPSTASEHLNRLIAGGLLAEQRQGRHRYVRLASPQVAQMIEDLAGHGTPVPAPARSLRAARANAALLRARTCYDHLAGRLGVLLLDALVDQGVLDRTGGLALTDQGRNWLAGLGIDPAALPSDRPLVRECLDWTERRPHLAGTTGAALLRHLLDRGWLLRIPQHRALRITPAGEHALTDLLGMSSADLHRT